MPFYADLHIHSKYSRACSRDCDLEHLAWWARRKGVTVVGSGDFTHPAWFEHLRENLEPAEPGLFRLREQLDRGVERTLPVSCRGLVRFMLSVEISTIYKRAERTRKVHHLVYVPDLEAAERFNRRLGRIGNIASDGRPILGLDSRDLLEITLESGPGSYLVPAHAWTPWFAVLGSKSGFDAVDDCYLDLADHIFALETGLSSDPAMNWRVSSLDRFRLVSNSDAHSPPMLGREACVFSSEMDYFSMRRALETGEGYGGTVEFFPEEGKYHLDGHRKCDVCMEPTETRRRQGRCPVCGKPLTVGVLHRVEELADRPEGARLEGAAGFRNLIQLPEIVGETLRVGPKSKAVAAQIDALTERLGPELGILTTAPLDEVARVGSSLLAEALGRLREGRVLREAGYDGEYGVIRLFERGELERPASTAVLFEPPPQVAATPKARRAWPAAEDASAVPAPPPAPAPTPETPTTGQGGSLPPPVALEPQPGHAEGGASRGEPRSPLDHLDPDQRAAAVVVEGPLLIVAVPGDHLHPPGGRGAAAAPRRAPRRTGGRRHRGDLPQPGPGDRRRAARRARARPRRARRRRGRAARGPARGQRRLGGAGAAAGGRGLPAQAGQGGARSQRGARARRRGGGRPPRPQRQGAPRARPGRPRRPDRAAGHPARRRPRAGGAVPRPLGLDLGGRVPGRRRIAVPAAAAAHHARRQPLRDRRRGPGDRAGDARAWPRAARQRRPNRAAAPARPPGGQRGRRGRVRGAHHRAAAGWLHLLLVRQRAGRRRRRVRPVVRGRGRAVPHRRAVPRPGGGAVQSGDALPEALPRPPRRPARRAAGAAGAPPSAGPGRRGGRHHGGAGGGPVRAGPRPPGRARGRGRRSRGRPAAGPGGPLRRRPGPVPRRAGARRAGGHMGPARGPRLAAHPARGQGAGVPGGVPGRLRGRPAAAAVRGHDQGPLAPVPELGGAARPARHDRRQRSVPVPGRDRRGAAGAAGGLRRRQAPGGAQGRPALVARVADPDPVSAGRD